MYISCIIIGIKGFTGKELLKIIIQHINIKFIYIILRKKDKFLKQKHEEFIKYNFLKLKILNLDKFKFNILFSCLPNNIFQKILKFIFIYKIKIIDLSANFRFKSLILNKIYNIKHNYIKIQKYFLYGYIEEYKNINFNIYYIANPGCYVNLTLNIIFPLIRKNFIFNNILINAINGTSGIGRKISNEKFLHYFQYNNVIPYALEGHKHTIEIVNIIYKFTKKKSKVSLCTAHGNFVKGIFLFLISKIKKNFLKNNFQIFNFLNWYNKKNIFIKIYNTKNIKNKNYKYSSLSKIIYTNSSYISFNISNINKEIRFIGNIDNLIKGASGTALENMNILFKNKNSLCLPI